MSRCQRGHSNCPQCLRQDLIHRHAAALTVLGIRGTYGITLPLSVVTHISVLSGVVMDAIAYSRDIGIPLNSTQLLSLALISPSAHNRPPCHSDSSAAQ